MQGWHNQAQEDICSYLKVKPENGLPNGEAKGRLSQVGFNQLVQKAKISPWKLFLAQFKDFMVIVLLAATVISFLLGEIADSVTILAIVIINAVLGFIQEYRAEKSIDALREMTAPEAWVLRDSCELKIPARELVPGDVVLLHSGDIIPADLRLLASSGLEIEEATLTGESFPVRKDAQVLCESNSAMGDRKNMAYMGTVVTRGQGTGVVVDTGMETEIGKIAGLIQNVQEGQTPLQIRLASLGKWLVVFCLLIVAVVVVTGIWRGEEPYQMFLVGVSLAVAAIPEGLPAIVTVALAVGVQKMLKRRAVIRKLPAVETLGCATVICSDKTGTLTQNAMTVRKVYADNQVYEVTGSGYNPEGIIEGQNIKAKGQQGLTALLMAAALCNNAKVGTKGQGGLSRQKQGSGWQIIGEPTEGALTVLTAKAGLYRDQIEGGRPRLYEVPFDSARKLMSVVYPRPGGQTVYTKGAPDYLLERCTHLWWQGKVQPLTEALKETVLNQNEAMAGQALRVLGFAYRELPQTFDPEKSEAELENQLIFLGLTGMIDPPRKEVLPAVRRCHQAGIKVVMITGDHKVTAGSIAKELGIFQGRDQILTGAELDQLSDKQLAKAVDNITVYARVSPNHKLRIVEALRKKGHIVAMTGDGVNDAPAVKEADIGIAMGITGTDVTKEASAMILSDDNFATIVAAVEEGRGIYDNIRKFIRYLLSCNVGEVLTMFFASLMGLPIPLIPIQILWVNLVTDGLPAMALGVDPNSPDIMTRKPRAPKESIFAQGLSWKIATRGLMIGCGTLVAYILGYYFSNGDLDYGRTMAFTTLVFSQLFHVFDCRSEHYSIFEIGLFTNRYLIAAVLCSITMQLAVIYFPPLQQVFQTLPLDLFSWGIILAISGGLTVFFGLYRKVMSTLGR